ncbi:SDR family oxidoreductase [Rhizobium sp. PL01]|uniref:SDR family oxidoreductase n=1 Tax=Rhizobium sp. PL01 TaxID=3085631 RepID=UPI0029821080|nr:SDR family oxidoreductase [Rhizobium sp. PL01]MDW5316793.1 SDR family oxidoreductase [Rhizobium sp. PL01]
MVVEPNQIAHPTVLITGASRGLGREMAQQYAATGWRVIACGRASAALVEDSIVPEMLDVADPASIIDLARRLAGVPIDVLINNAGIRGDTGGLQTLGPDDFLEVMRINTLGPLLVTRALLPNLVTGTRKTVANISSRAGSITEGTLDDDDGDYAYRCSKAALNMATVKLAHDLRANGIAVLSLHPGWVKTDMGGDGAVVPVADSAAGLRRIIDRATLAESGGFRTFDGQAVSW